MTINDQIEAAWKEELPKVRESLQCSRASQVLGAAEIGFAAGYRAALRGLYIEVKLADVKGCTDYITLENGKWWSRWWHDHLWALEQATKCEKIFVVSIPSPAEVFGEGG